MKALIIGATGATGKDLLEKLLQDSDFEEVHAFVRRPINFENEKLHVHIVDFDKPDDWKSLVKGDVAFSCLGTTLKDAGSKDAQYKVDHDYQYNFAKAAKENNVEDYILISSFGANPSSKVFYTRMKGELEESIKNLKFDKLTIFQPGMLERKNTERSSEVISRTIINLVNRFGFLKSQKPLPTAILAQAMLNAAKIQSNGYSVIKLGNIFSFAQKNNH